MSWGDLSPALRRGSTQKHICDHSHVLPTTDLSGGAHFSFHNNNDIYIYICVCMVVNCSLRTDRKRERKKEKMPETGDPSCSGDGTGWHWKPCQTTLKLFPFSQGENILEKGNSKTLVYPAVCTK